MTTIQNIIIALFVIFCAALPCFIARADTIAIESSSRTTNLEVQMVPGHLDVCSRIDSSTLSCVRIKKGEKPVTFIVKK